MLKSKEETTKPLKSTTLLSGTIQTRPPLQQTLAPRRPLKNLMPQAQSPTHARRRPKTETAQQKSDREAITARCKVYGHNNLQIGQTFKSRAEIREKDGHSMTSTGVCAGKDGAYAVVVADAYSSFNRDFGKDIDFAATGVNRLRLGVKLDNTFVKAMERSVHGKQPVRVFRGARKTKTVKNTYQTYLLDQSHGGFRYDGLYDVIGTGWTGEEGKKYQVFHLKRRTDQAALDLSLS